MRDFGTVASAFWEDDKVRGMSDRAKLLALYLLTGPSSNLVGCYRLHPDYMAEDLNWPREAVWEALEEVCQTGFASFCGKTHLVLLPRYLKWNPFSNPNVSKKALKIIDTLPRQTVVFNALLKSLKASAKHLPKRFEEGFFDKLPKPYEEPYSEPTEKPTDKGSLQNLGNQEQEQEQYQEEDSASALAEAEAESSEALLPETELADRPENGDDMAPHPDFLRRGAG